MVDIQTDGKPGPGPIAASLASERVMPHCLTLVVMHLEELRQLAPTTRTLWQTLERPTGARLHPPSGEPRRRRQRHDRPGPRRPATPDPDRPGPRASAAGHLHRLVASMRSTRA